MAEPPDQMPATGRGHLRASHADREQAVETLKAAFIQGRLTKDEFDLRVSQALASRTYAELAAVTANFPARLTTAKVPAPARAQGGQQVLRPGPVITAATVLYAAVWVYASFFPHGEGANGPAMFVMLTFVGGFFYLIISAMCVGQVVALRHERRSGRQPPKRPATGAGDQASQGQPSADPGGELPPVDPGPQHTEAARSRRPRSPLPGSRSVRRWRDRGLPAGQRAAITHTA